MLSCLCEQFSCGAQQFHSSVHTLKNSCTRVLEELSKKVPNSIACINNKQKAQMATQRRMDKNKLWYVHTMVLHKSENKLKLYEKNEYILENIASFRKLYTML